MMPNFAIDKAERRLAFRTDEYEIYGFWVCMGWTPALQAGYQMGSIPIGSTIFAGVAQLGRAAPLEGASSAVQIRSLACYFMYGS